MGKEDLEAKVRLTGDAKGATAAIKKTEKGFRRLGGTFKKVSLANVAALAGVVVAIRGAVRAIGSFVAAAQVQEDAINALDGALSDLGAGADNVSAALQRQAAALQQVSKFGDEEIIQAQALIGSFVKERSAIEAATKASLDLAEAKGFSLVSAADLVAKTLGSSTNALTRYGIEVTGAVGSTERLTSLTENIAKVFGGRAAKAAETFSGRVQQLKNAVGDMQEEIGFAITKNEGLIDGINDLKENVVSLTPEIAELAVTIVSVSTSMINGLIAFGEYIGEFSTLIGVTGNLNTANAETVVSLTALESTAFRLGITVEELQLRLVGAVVETRSIGVASKEAAGGLSAAAKEAEAAAKAMKALEKEAKDSADAMDELGEALGEITSIELAEEISDIEEALEKARETTGGLGREFERLEEVAAGKIDSLKARIEGLRDGVGDLGDEAARTADRTDDLGRAMGSASSDAEALSRGVRSTSSALRLVTADASSASREFDRLSRSSQGVAQSQQRVATTPTLFGRTSLTRGGETTINTGFWTGSYTITTLPDGTRVYS